MDYTLNYFPFNIIVYQHFLAEMYGNKNDGATINSSWDIQRDFSNLNS